MDIDNTNPRQNLPPEKSTQPSEDNNVDDPPSPPVQPRKKGKVGTRKRLPESEDSDVDPLPSSIQPQKKIQLGSEGTRTQKKKRNKPSSHKKKANDDSDIEIVEESPETPEKELGMLNQ